MVRKKKIQYEVSAPERTLRDAALVEYAPQIPADVELTMSAKTRLSTKNQITLPSAMIRQLSLRPGDEIGLLAIGGAIRLERRPQTPEEWTDRLAGALNGIPAWSTDDGIDAWIREERDTWDREWQHDEASS